jgi:NADH:ubiquinone oxidoreductase subunit 3 (subunit A)
MAWGRPRHSRPVKGDALKKLVELLLCFLHPIAVILMWINLVSRRDLGTVSKLAWAIFGLIPFVPFLYVLTGGNLF